MLIIYHSNQLDVLKTIIASLMIKYPLKDPFHDEIILVPNNMMARWIKISLASFFGISANIEYQLLENFIWNIFNIFFPDVPKESAFSKTSMIWRIMSIISNLKNQPNLKIINEYLGNDESKLKTFRFSSQIADLFDKYLVYRPDWLNIWQNNKIIDGLNKSQHWQSMLWIELLKDIKNSGQLLWHIASLCQRFTNTIKKNIIPCSNLPKRIFICGISYIPFIYLKSLQLFSRYIDIHLLFLNPCKYYWGDYQDYNCLLHSIKKKYVNYICKKEKNTLHSHKSLNTLINTLKANKPENTLLTSWGKQGRDTIYLLTQIDGISEIDAFVEITENNLLKCLQKDILLLKDYTLINLKKNKFSNNITKRKLQINDRSISFHLCYSIQREIEVLHDSLLSTIKKNPSIQPKDIIVIVSDIESYIPAINSVFNKTNNLDYYIPYVISDQSSLYLHSVILIFLKLLEIPHSRFSITEVFSLLEEPSLAACFNIDEPAFKILRKLVIKSGIRWGLDSDMLNELMLPSIKEHTWEFGLKRILLGYSIGKNYGDWKGIKPYKETNGYMVYLIGQLSELLNRLAKWRNYLKKSRSLKDWLECANKIIKDFFVGNDKKIKSAFYLIEKHWKNIILYGIKVKYNEQVNISLLKSELLKQLKKEKINNNFLNGSLNFCTFIPMRSIPFKIICLLGMNYGVYPKLTTSLDFNLMSKKPRVGDYNKRDEDKYILLETILSAQDKLYISCVRNDSIDNTLTHPAILITELSDYIAQNFYLSGDKNILPEISEKNVRKHIWQNYSKTPFSQENFIPGTEQQSFASHWLSAAKLIGKDKSDFSKINLKKFTCNTISLDDFLNFYEHPVRSWFIKRLSICFYYNTSKDIENESFTIDDSSLYKLNKKLLNTIFKKSNIIKLFFEAQYTGLLPYGVFGKLQFIKQYKAMQYFAKKIIIYKSKYIDNINIRLKLNEILLFGVLKNIQKNGLFTYYPRMLSMQDGLLFWIQHLIYCYIGGKGNSIILGTDSRWCFPSIDESIAKKLLISLISGYINGMTKPLLLIPYYGEIWLRHCFDKINKRINWEEKIQNQACNKIIYAWKTKNYTFNNIKDPYLNRLIYKLNKKNVKSIIEASEKYLLPFFMFLE